MGSDLTVRGWECFKKMRQTTEIEWINEMYWQWTQGTQNNTIKLEVMLLKVKSLFSPYYKTVNKKLVASLNVFSMCKCPPVYLLFCSDNPMKCSG